MCHLRNGGYFASASICHRTRKAIKQLPAIVPSESVGADLSHNVPVSYPAMHHFGTEVCTYVTKMVHCGIFGASWYLCRTYLRNINIYFHFSTLRWHRFLKSFLAQDKDASIILHIQWFTIKGTRGSGAPAAMILTYFFVGIPVSVPEGLNPFVFTCAEQMPVI